MKAPKRARGSLPERQTGGPRGPAWGRPAGLGAWVWGGTPHGDGCSVVRVGGNRRFLQSRTSWLFQVFGSPGWRKSKISAKPGVLMVINAATENNQCVFLAIIGKDCMELINHEYLYIV